MRDGSGIIGYMMNLIRTWLLKITKLPADITARLISISVNRREESSPEKYFATETKLKETKSRFADRFFNAEEISDSDAKSFLLAMEPKRINKAMQ